jgi:DNA modification methylase
MENIKIEYWPVERLRPYANSPRDNDAHVDRMADALREYGFRLPLLVRGDGELVDGHLRLKAALRMGVTSLPVAVVDGMDPARLRAFRLLVNRSAAWAEWNNDLLMVELQALLLEDIDISLTGFDEVELAKLLPDSDPAMPDVLEEDVPPEAPADPVTLPGDVWLMGGHALACADAADADSVAALMDAGPASLCFTSPPYDGQREYTRKIGDWDALMRGVFSNTPLLPDGQMLVNLGLVHRDGELRRYWNGWLDFMRASGWRFFSLYVWDQGAGLPGDWNGRLAPAFEFVFHFNLEARHPNKIVPCSNAGVIKTTGNLRNEDGKARGWTHRGRPIQDFRIPDSVIRVSRQNGSIGEGIDHPAVFSVGFAEHVISSWTRPGDVVYEPFCGSGSTIIAGQRKGVKVRAVEIAPAYVDVAVIRFSRLYPDIPVTLRSTGRDFAAVSLERKGASHV